MTCINMALCYHVIVFGHNVSPTTNIVERANSQAKLIMTDRRDRLLPETQNMLMILKHNKSLWRTDNSIQEILDSDNFRDPEQEPDREEEEDRQSLVLTPNQTRSFHFELRDWRSHQKKRNSYIYNNINSKKACRLTFMVICVHLWISHWKQIFGKCDCTLVFVGRLHGQGEC